MQNEGTHRRSAPALHVCEGRASSRARRVDNLLCCCSRPCLECWKCRPVLRDALDGHNAHGAVPTRHCHIQEPAGAMTAWLQEPSPYPWACPNARLHLVPGTDAYIGQGRLACSPFSPPIDSGRLLSWRQWLTSSVRSAVSPPIDSGRLVSWLHLLTLSVCSAVSPLIDSGRLRSWLQLRTPSVRSAVSPPIESGRLLSCLHFLT